MGMDINAYQVGAKATVQYSQENAIIVSALGLTGEAGEVADMIKKIIRDSDKELNEESLSKLASELGDVLWYIALLAWELGFTLDEIAKLNLKKIFDRYGYASSEKGQE
tara:strand:- start:2146 stop:2472 length:327 start_codon:yes stop_codon:yes gene_type:complete